jgi:hypothetical protein
MSFSRYATDDSVISAESIVRPMWTGDVYRLKNFWNDLFASTSEYYLDIRQSNITTSGSEVQYSLQYGHIYGSGSAPISSTPGYSPSRIVYGQYRNLVYGTETENFSFNNGQSTAEQIYVINISRARYKQSINPGSFNLTLSSGSGGNQQTIRLTDDSNTTSLTRFIGENRIFYIISGSNGNAWTPSAATTYYGMMLPDLGIIILDASGSLSPFIEKADLSTTAVKNQFKLNFSIITGSLISTNDGFSAQSQETVSSRFFFTRIKNGEFNYTTNPSIIDANGNLLYTTLIDNPQTFITTVGMYNDNNELLAVAKLSKPLVKDFTKEALVRIKLDY